MFRFSQLNQSIDFLTKHHQAQVATSFLLRPGDSDMLQPEAHLGPQEGGPGMDQPPKQLDLEYPNWNLTIRKYVL